MAETKQDRARAAKLRKKKKKTPEDRRWLSAYDTRVTIAKAKAKAALPSSATYTPPERPTLLLRGDATDDNAATSHAAVQETLPPEGSIAAEQHTWIPTVPPPAPDAEPPSPGQEAPKEGTPLVDAQPTTGEGGAESANVAAQQMAAFVCMFAEIGIESGLILAQDFPLIPSHVLAMAASPQMRSRAMAFFGGAGYRTAVKYGFRSLPMADELTCVVAVAGGIAASLALQKKLAKAANKEASPVEARDKAPEEQREHDAKQPPKPDAEVVAQALSVLRRTS